MSWSLAGAAVLALTAALVFLGLNTERMAASRVGIYAILAVAVGMYAGTGRLITSRVPGNAIGWLLGLIGLSLAVTMLAEQYALYGLATAPGSMPAARLAGWFSSALPCSRWCSCSFSSCCSRMGGYLRAGGVRCGGRCTRS
jgi:hypothetical protein